MEDQRDQGPTATTSAPAAAEKPISLEAAARATGVSQRTLFRWITEGRLPATRMPYRRKNHVLLSEARACMADRRPVIGRPRRDPAPPSRWEDDAAQRFVQAARICLGGQQRPDASATELALRMGMRAILDEDPHTTADALARIALSYGRATHPLISSEQDQAEAGRLAREERACFEAHLDRCTSDLQTLRAHPTPLGNAWRVVTARIREGMPAIATEPWLPAAVELGRQLRRDHPDLPEPMLAWWLENAMLSGGPPPPISFPRTADLARARNTPAKAKWPRATPSVLHRRHLRTVAIKAARLVTATARIDESAP